MARPPVKSADSKVEWTHTDRIMFPQKGYTKGDILTFYQKIAPRLLPYLKDRPITIERLPAGVGSGPRFWQKHTPPHYPQWIPRATLPTEKGEPVEYALVNDLDTLLFLVNQGTLTFHPFLSRIENLDHPDFVLFDLDPGKASFSDVVTVARSLHQILDSQDIPSFPKTSGKSGLHVLVPWKQNGGYDDARAWAEQQATQVIGALPNLATLERSKVKRGKRVYIDVVQNAKGHHVVPPYVVRAVPEAAVSTPLQWSEVNDSLDPKAFDIKTIFDRLKRQKKDPMAGLKLARS